MHRCRTCLLLQCDHFFFLMEGEVQLQRGGVNLGTLVEGSFVVSGSVFKLASSCSLVCMLRHVFVRGEVA
jgi:hypothetical protein